VSGEPSQHPTPLAAPSVAESGEGAGGRLLEVRELRVSFDTEAGPVRAVDGVSFAVAAGEVVALVGESGSGKSVTAMSLLGLTRPLGARVSGRATFEGTDLIGASDNELRRIRGGRAAMVFQDPMSSLNPVLRVGDQIAEQIRAHERTTTRAQALERAGELMERVGIGEAGAVGPGRAGRARLGGAGLAGAGGAGLNPRVRAFPHELSGGMRQRVMIAMALSCSPSLLIADEPTTALDVTTQAQILALLRELRAQTGVAILLVTHDLGIVADIADRILVMRSGQLVEQGSAEEIAGAARHPYTQSLLTAHRTRLARTPRRGGAPLLETRELTVHFPASGGRAARPRAGHAHVQALDGVSLTLYEGETLGVVGESGCGKTTLLRCLVRLQKPTSGTVSFRGTDMTHASRRRLIPVRRELQMVFQDPQASLNPRRRVDWILQTGLRLRNVPRAQWRARAGELLLRVGLGGEHLERFPHELSGGERQRVGIARALSCEPLALVLDEPVSSLDASLRAQVLELLARLQEELQLSYLLVAHDLGVVRDVSDRVAVMRAGRVVEEAPTAELFGAPKHPYTRELLAAGGLENGSLPTPQVRSAG
jgi:peptide/nickel transport system ATP-binding protein